MATTKTTTAKTRKAPAKKKDELELRSPWMCYVNRVKALFDPDPKVDVIFSEETMELRVRVHSADKAAAIEKLLPNGLIFGNVKLIVTVVYANDELSEAETYRRAFNGNPLFFNVVEEYGPAKDISYALFKPEVLQINDDDISQWMGRSTSTVADIAKTVLEEGDIRISSSIN